MVSDEESALLRLVVADESNPESAHVDILVVDHVTVMGLPLSTRLGLTVRLLIEPFTTQAAPTCA